MFDFPDDGFTKLPRRTMQKLSKQTAAWARQKQKENGIAWALLPNSYFFIRPFSLPF
jgi:hypothetical protein